MKKIVSISILALFLSACSSMQGVVRDKDSGTPIPSAHVKINKNSATTDALGHYKVTGSFFPGDTMIVNASGYNIYTKTVKKRKEIVDIDLSKKQ
jgi:predicted small secreted protein